MIFTREILEENQLYLKFRNERLTKWKIGNNFTCYRPHGEGANVDLNVISLKLPVLQEKIKNNRVKHIWNADEFSIFHQMNPIDTIAAARIFGRETMKERMTSFSFCNANRTEKRPLFSMKNQDFSLSLWQNII